MNFNEWATLVSIVSGFVVGSVTWSVWASWWLGKQFSQTRNMIYQSTKEVQTVFEAKLDYHEKHDDQRFQSLSNDLWDIRVRNAARDGLPPLVSRDKSI